MAILGVVGEGEEGEGGIRGARKGVRIEREATKEPWRRGFRIACYEPVV